MALKRRKPGNLIMPLNKFAMSLLFLYYFIPTASISEFLFLFSIPSLVAISWILILDQVSTHKKHIPQARIFFLSRGFLSCVGRGFISLFTEQPTLSTTNRTRQKKTVSDEQKNEYFLRILCKIDKN